MTKKYALVDDEKRMHLINLIYEKGQSIAQAARNAGINYNAAKVVNNIWKKEGRVNKKTERKCRGHSKKHK